MDGKDQLGAALPPPSKAASIPVHNQMAPIYFQHCWLTSRHLRTEVDVAGHRVGSQQSLRVGVPLPVLQQPGQA